MGQVSPSADQSAQNRADKFANVGLVAGILAVLTCGILGLPAAIVAALGLKSESRRSRAIAGLVLSLVSLPLIFVLGVLVAIAVPSFHRAKTISQRNLCQSNLLKIDGAKIQWSLEEDVEDGAVAPTWDDLVGDFIIRHPVCPAGGEYTIGTLDELPSCSAIHGPFPHTFPDVEDEYISYEE